MSQIRHLANRCLACIRSARPCVNRESRNSTGRSTSAVSSASRTSARRYARTRFDALRRSPGIVVRWRTAHARQGRDRQQLAVGQGRDPPTPCTGRPCRRNPRLGHGVSAVDRLEHPGVVARRLHAELVGSETIEHGLGRSRLRRTRWSALRGCLNSSLVGRLLRLTPTK